MVCHALLHGIFLTQRLNQNLLHWQAGSLPVVPPEKPIINYNTVKMHVHVFFFFCIYAGQEATVRTGHGTTDWFQIGKRVCPGCILSPCLFNLYALYIMRNAGLEEAQAGIKIARRNINNLSYADDTAIMTESEEELKSPF